MPTPRPGSRKSSLQPTDLPRSRLLPRNSRQQSGRRDPRRASLDSETRTPRLPPPTKPSTPSLSPRSDDTPRRLALDLAPSTVSFPGRKSSTGGIFSTPPSPSPTSPRPLSSRPLSSHPLSPRSRTPHSGRAVPSTWGEYVQCLQDRGYVSQAAVFSLEGKQWAATHDFQVKREEVLRLVEGYPDCSELVREGMVLGGTRYTLLRVCGGPIFVGRDCTTGGGCVLYRCRSCLLLALYEDHAHSAACYSVIEKLGDFLREKGI